VLLIGPLNELYVCRFEVKKYGTKVILVEKHEIINDKYLQKLLLNVIHLKRRTNNVSNV